jgi:HSP20 family protein
MSDMKLIRQPTSAVWNWQPVEQLSTLREEINRLFDSPFGELTRRMELFNGWSPTLDLYEDKDNLIVKAELPGLKREEIDISVHDGTLTISGERNYEEQKDDAETYRSERFFGRFHRTLTLPKPVESDQAKASYKDGILTVTLPKTEEAKPKQIQVNVG